MRKAAAALLTGGKRLLTGDSVLFSVRASEQKFATPSQLQVARCPLTLNLPQTAFPESVRRLLRWLSCSKISGTPVYSSRPILCTGAYKPLRALTLQQDCKGGSPCAGAVSTTQLQCMQTIQQCLI